jgi:polysaccharide pyruvyl transferase WcaK-like protein
MVAAVEERLSRPADDRPATWPTGDPVRLLLVGYSGAHNIGADIRVAELVRQLRHVFGPERIDFELLAIGEQRLAEQPPGVITTRAEGYLPQLLGKRIASADGVMACEGSMFKSDFSNMLALLLTGSLAMASAQRKLALAWGAEAGAMDDRLRDFTRRFCRDALIVARNPPSEQALAGLGLRTFLGADPAWTYRPSPAGRAEELLRGVGWDGAASVTCVCPVNPFWYPVKPDLARAREMARTGAHRADHFASVLFHEHSPDSVRRYEHYLDQLACSIRERTARPGQFVILLGMEMLDRQACEDLAARLPAGAPVLLGDRLAAADVVAILRRSDLVISSRYHAILTAIPGLTPAIGVFHDERISNLLGELGRPDLGIPVGASDLADQVTAAIAAATADPDGLRQAQGRLVAEQVRRIGDSGRQAAAEVSRVYPGFHAPDTTSGWDRFVPPVDAVVEEFLERYA